MESSLTELFLSGGRLMLIGMGIVYLFLALLITIISISARYLQHDKTGQLITDSHVENEEGAVIAAIVTAVYQNKSKQGTKQ